MSPVRLFRQDPGRWERKFGRQVDALLATTNPPRQLAVPIPGNFINQLLVLLLISVRVMAERV